MGIIVAVCAGLLFRLSSLVIPAVLASAIVSTLSFTGGPFSGIVFLTTLPAAIGGYMAGAIVGTLAVRLFRRRWKSEGKIDDGVKPGLIRWTLD